MVDNGGEPVRLSTPNFWQAFRRCDSTVLIDRKG